MNLSNLIKELTKLEEEGNGGLEVHYSDSQGGMPRLSGSTSVFEHENYDYPSWGGIVEEALGIRYVILHSDE